MPSTRSTQLKTELEKVIAVLEATPPVDPTRAIPAHEYRARQGRVWEAVADLGCDAGFVFSNEHYEGDVPYLAGNTNITVEQVAGVIGANGFHVIAGLEGGYVVEQLAVRSGAPVHKVEMLQLADEDYPIDAERPEAVFEQACGRQPRRIALLSPREVVPTMLVEWLRHYFGPDSVVPASDVYGRIKYEKSDAEMALARDATTIGDAALRAMLAVLKPGLRETQVAAWGYFALRELGAEESGVDIMVNAGESNRSLIGKALNSVIQPGDMVHLGVSARRDGLCGCTRRSVVALDPGQPMPAAHRYWLDFVVDAYRAGHEQFIVTARDDLPAYTIEKAVVDYVAGRSAEVSQRVGRPIDLVRQKPYTCVHNSGYTECMEFYGAITLSSQEPLGNQIVNMLDVAMRGIGNHWNDVIIPDLEYVVVENTFGKTGRNAECLNSVPEDCQALVGRGVA